MQAKRSRVLDSRGRPVTGLYERDGAFIAGFRCPQTSRWRMQNLSARTLTEARRERDGLIAGLREGRRAAPAQVTFDEVFAEYQASRKIGDRTLKHERHLLDRHLAAVKGRRVQDVTTTDVARLLRALSDRYSPWTCVAVYRILAGTLALAARRGIVTRNPMDGIAPSERPKQTNLRRVQVLEPARLETLIDAARSERWRAALALAAYGGLRLGEIRALTWSDVDFKAGTVNVERSMLPDGTVKAPKTAAGVRAVPLLPALRRRLREWELRARFSRPSDFVIGTADGMPTDERNVNRALTDAKVAAGLMVTDGRLSMHSLRHAFASMLATDLQVPATTLARVTGHSDPGFTFKVYARDARDDAAVVEDVLARAVAAGVGA